eukprot:CAMPEP_0201570572 /NCGR_PEP_ID=MMETSP0190_2-20130828/12886_1 /ASSEMBLY_ACC=CAM_ASM_000263 /TAXON_ID=37353 /ORGANISM="Rosalina sp." /LENGTH=88 /DNA_ID=CAMNT_0047994233 /DNA_START=301 /DNA_END=567 /DNA_ORIENTATION=+
MARIEREQKEAESRDNLEDDDISEENKTMEQPQDIISEISEESKIQDLRQNEQHNDENEQVNNIDMDNIDDSIDLPGMINRHLNLDLD